MLKGKPHFARGYLREKECYDFQRPPRLVVGFARIRPEKIPHVALEARKELRNLKPCFFPNLPSRGIFRKFIPLQMPLRKVPMPRLVVEKEKLTPRLPCANPRVSPLRK